MFIFKITSPMNSYDGSFFKYDKTFASDLCLIYKLSPSARVCISDTDRLLMFYLVHKQCKSFTITSSSSSGVQRMVVNVRNVDTDKSKEKKLEPRLHYAQFLVRHG